MNRFVSSILCAVFGGAAVWLLLRATAEPVLPATFERPAEVVSEHVDPIVETLVDLDSDPVPSDYDDEVERLDLEDPNGAPRPGPVLTVVDTGANGQPVPAAEVFYAVRESAHEANGDRPLQHVAELPVRYGVKATTDGEGRVRLPPIRGPVLVVARKDGQFGFRVIGPHHAEEERLGLVTDETLRIAILDDESGEGVRDVPVGIFERDGRRMRRRLRVLSDEAGKVVIPHFQLHREKLRAQGSEFVAAVLAPFA
ncbi:MAG: hypothetical protein KDB80_09160, partial [Planctomycetes bacterium]|nr:hypothetical protein [Planctomycetota bacterium]